MRKTKPKNDGRFYLKVFFIDHWLDKAFKCQSNKWQDQKGISERRLKNLVLKNWQGKVNWAMLFENGQPISKYTFQTNQWENL